MMQIFGALVNELEILRRGLQEAKVSHSDSFPELA